MVSNINSNRKCKVGASRFVLLEKFLLQCVHGKNIIQIPSDNKIHV